VGDPPPGGHRHASSTVALASPLARDRGRRPRARAVERQGSAGDAQAEHRQIVGQQVGGAETARLRAEHERQAGDDAADDAGEAVTEDDTDETALDGEAAALPAFLADDADPSADEPGTIAGEDTDHLQAAE
jgi:ParB family chromosome partitioning protein